MVEGEHADRWGKGNGTFVFYEFLLLESTSEIASVTGFFVSLPVLISDYFLQNWIANKNTPKNLSQKVRRGRGFRETSSSVWSWKTILSCSFPVHVIADRSKFRYNIISDNSASRRVRYGARFKCTPSTPPQIWPPYPIAPKNNMIYSL